MCVCVCVSVTSIILNFVSLNNFTENKHFIYRVYYVMLSSLFLFEMLMCFLLCLFNHLSLFLKCLKLRFA